MAIEMDRQEDVLLMKISERLDMITSPELDEVLNTKLDGVHELIFDFESLEYVSSAGLRVILQAQKIMEDQGSLKLIHVNDDIMKVFAMTGFADILTIE